MTSDRSVFNIKISVLLLLFTAYLLATVLGSQSMVYILSPLNAIICSAVIFAAFLKFTSPKESSLSYLFISLACLLWGIGDTVFAAVFFNGGIPSRSILAAILYFLAEIMMIAGLFSFSIQQFRKWNYIQFFVDTLIVGFTYLYFVYAVYLHKDLSLIGIMCRTDYMRLPGAICDLVILIGILSWMLSIRSGNLPPYVKIMAFGVSLLSITDLIYYYICFNSDSTFNFIIGFLYMISLLIIAIGALHKRYLFPTEFDYSLVTNRGRKKNWLFLITFPLLAIILKQFGILPVSVGFWDIALYVFAIVLYALACNYIQLSIANERLLENEKLMNNILEKRVEQQTTKLSFLENQDLLTALFNRSYFISRLEHAIYSYPDCGLPAVILIDIDRFKAVNESFGHDTGDKVLIEISSRLNTWNRCGAVIARLSGDEFAVLICGEYERKDIECFCREIIEICSLPINLSFESLKISVSIGAALFSKDAGNAVSLLKGADIALYRAKQQGYGKYQYYDPFFNNQISKSNELVRLLRKADTNKDFELLYQPQFALPSFRLIGAEALIRWKDPKHGYILPSEFIPIAEETGCISEIGRWVMVEAVRQGSEWNSKYGTSLEIGFNVSVKQLADDSFAEALKDAAAQDGFNAGWIGAEITESFMILDRDRVRNILELFSQLGITVSIDDFGSGYASYGYLNEFHFDKIKIDKSLIDRLSRQTPATINVLNAIISMAKALGVTTLAEGVETREQLEILTELGCDQIQGFLLGRPVPPEVFEASFIAD